MSAQWPYLTSEEGREDVLAAEFVAQFDGYDPARVDRAATLAIGKATKGAPTAAEIKAELWSESIEQRPSDRRGYEPSPAVRAQDRARFAAWRANDQALTREAVARVKALEARSEFEDFETINARNTAG